jgi:hypothetical protein
MHTQEVPACLIRSGGAGGPHVRAGSRAETGGSRKQAEGASRATCPRDVGMGNERSVGNKEVRDTSKRGRPDARVQIVDVRMHASRLWTSGCTRPSERPSASISLFLLAMLPCVCV